MKSVRAFPQDSYRAPQTIKSSSPCCHRSVRPLWRLPSEVKSFPADSFTYTFGLAGVYSHSRSARSRGHYCAHSRSRCMLPQLTQKPQTSTWEDGWLLFQSYEKHSYLHPSLGKRSSFDRSPSPLRVHENCRYSIFFQPPSLQRFFARSTRLFSSNIPLRDAVFFFPTHVRISSQEAYFDRVQPNRPYNKKQNIKYRSTTDFQSCDTYTMVAPTRKPTCDDILCFVTSRSSFRWRPLISAKFDVQYRIYSYISFYE